MKRNNWEYKIKKKIKIENDYAKSHFVAEKMIESAPDITADSIIY